ncbi:hypothetical protein ACWDA3_55370 [Nonomuraea rubra]
MTVLPVVVTRGIRPARPGGSAGRLAPARGGRHRSDGRRRVRWRGGGDGHEHLPAAGEIVLFDRSWYNRAGAEDKRRARINMISHLLSTVPYSEVERPPLKIPPRPAPTGYRRPPRVETPVPDVTGDLG